jgi:DNA-directed RNA polymerase specialized sigma24 family protein
MASTDLFTLDLATLAQHCAEESDKFFQGVAHVADYCFELFRRAIVGRSSTAWSHIYHQYTRLVGAWVRRHPRFDQTGGDVDGLVHEAFTRMWQAITPDRFPQFPDLRSLLSYLKMCVNSAILDALRRQSSEELVDQVYKLPEPAGIGSDELDRLDALALWQQVHACLHDDREALIVHASFVQDLKPAEIHAQYPDQFADVSEVYNIKRNVLNRLRRAPILRADFGP